MPPKKDSSSNYDASKLQLVEGLEHVRKRPGMYIGSTGPKGLHHLIEEIVANSVDEAMAGFCTRIIVEVSDDNWVTVTDNARGIPVDVHPETGLSGLELVLTRLGGGGKWGADDGGYKVSGGLHGVGSSVVNAVSEQMKAVVHREGHEWTQSYKRGVPNGPVKKGKKVTDTGTIISWLYDPQIFDRNVKYDRAVIENRLRELSYLNPGLEFVLRFHGHKEEVFKSKHGLQDYMKYLVANNENISAVHTQPVVLQGAVSEEITHDSGTRTDTTEIDVALYWTSGQREMPHMFTNSINNNEGGTHYDGLRKGLRKALNEAAEELGKFRAKDARFEQTDTREGLYLAIAVRVGDPRFEGQTKTKLDNPEVDKRVDQFIASELKKFLLTKQNQEVADQIIQRVIEARDARLATANARAQTVQRKGLLGNTGLPGKLADCSSKDPSECEIFLVEGDSAGGGMKNQRNRDYQAILPLRGKIKNAEKSGESTLNSEAIKDILSALGGTIVPVTVQKKKGSKMVNESKLVVDLTEPRYHKIVMCSVDYEEMAFVRDREKTIHSVRIGEFIDDAIERDDVDGWEVMCFDVNTHQTRFRPIKQVIRHKIDEPLHRIDTAYGRSVRVTSSHSVFVYEDGEVVLKRGDEIAVGDMVVAPRRLPLRGQPAEHIDLVRALHAHPDTARRIMLRGEGVARVREQRVRAAVADLPHGQPRVLLSELQRDQLRAARERAGLTLAQVAPLCDARSASSVSEWETGRGRPSVTALQAFCSAVELNAADILADSIIESSVVDANTAAATSSANRKRVRSVMRLSDLRPDEFDLLGSDVTLESEKHPTTTTTGRYLPLDAQFFFLAGLYAAEGSSGERAGARFSLGPGDDERGVTDEVIAASQALFGITPARYDQTGNRGFELRIQSALVRAVFDCVLRHQAATSHTKSIPDLVFNASSAQQLEYLRGLFLGDGSCGPRGQVTFNTVSDDLACGIAYLLQAHGVMASHVLVDSAKSRGGPIHAVSVTARNGLQRIRRVWESRLDAVTLSEQPPIDVQAGDRLPERVSVSAIAQFARCSEQAVRTAMSSGALAFEIEPHKERRDRTAAREDAIAWALSRGEINRRFSVISEDLVALPVRATSIVEPTTENVYDFSVEGDENFICGTGGICCHNTDADVDGGHIVTLLMTFFFRFAPDLIRDGRLYVAELPLYRIEHKKQGRLYLFTDEELQRYVKRDEIKRRPDGTPDVSRFKGLGEMQAEQLEELALNPASRKLRRVVIDDLAEAEDITTLLMGGRVDRRREYIEEHALDVEADI